MRNYLRLIFHWRAPSLGRSRVVRHPWSTAAKKMTWVVPLLSCALVHTAQALNSPSIVHLRVEYTENPLGVDARAPRLSWQMSSSTKGAAQSAYQIRVASAPDALRDSRGLLWDSGRVSSSESRFVPYQGPSLQSRQRYYWQVKIWDQSGRDLGWSSEAWWEMGLLTGTEWQASWISPASSAEEGDVPKVLRREFELSGRVRRARAYVTSHGAYELFLNGQRVGDQELTPGWTSYNHRLQYQVYDITASLKPGDNAIAANLANGWFRGVIGFDGIGRHYGTQLALLCQLEITYDDGRTERILTDADWKSSSGPIQQSDIYAGETYDARREMPGFSAPHFDDRGWLPIVLSDGAKDTLVASEGPPVHRIEELKPQRIFQTPGGDTVVDFGQNMVGRVRIRVRGAAGTTVVLRHAEVLDKQGNFYTDNLRSAKQTVSYTLSGRGTEVYEPHFTFQGFRYVAVKGYPGKLSQSDITGITLHSDMATTASFSTSNPLLNQLQHNIVWGQKGNFVDVPTDCPQRDERLGWTGDAQVFAPTAAFNRDVSGFFAKWLKDLAADQLPSGSVPFVVPDVVSTASEPAAGAAGWGDAATVIPWAIYQAYGDLHLLENQYASMQRWVEYEQSRAGADEIWDGDTHFGDWLDFFSAAKHTNYGSTSTDLIATAYFAHSTDIALRAARVLGRDSDARGYEKSLQKIKAEFQKRFVGSDGLVGDGTQTAYVLALDFDLLPVDSQPAAAARLAKDVRERGHLTTGFLGTPHLLDVLTRFGYLQEAYMLLNREQFPSWLYPVKHGATTIWERWDGVKPDGTFQDPSMNSFNHYAYGAVGDWMYQTIGGVRLDPHSPGYKHFIVEVQPGGGLTHARTTHQSPFGLISTAWSIGGNRLTLDVTVPPNSTATVRMPGVEVGAVKLGSKPVVTGDGVTALRQAGTDAEVEISAGHYQFLYSVIATADRSRGASASQ
jgi:alpha-L-rhamnosidase